MCLGGSDGRSVLIHPRAHGLTTPYAPSTRTATASASSMLIRGSQMLESTFRSVPTSSQPKKLRTSLYQASTTSTSASAALRSMTFLEA